MTTNQGVALSCDKCGPLDYILFDGYPFGDRMLEGVMFRFYPDGKVQIDDDDDAYWQSLNTKAWLEVAKECGPQVDVGACPKCGAEVAGPDEAVPQEEEQP